MPVQRRSVFFFFWLSQNNVTGVEMMKYLFRSQGLTSLLASPPKFKVKKFTCFDRDSNST